MSKLVSSCLAAALTGALLPGNIAAADGAQAAPTGAPPISPTNVWRPYDNANITSSANCQARRSWLIRNLNWITTINSRCQKFSIPQCPKPRTTWKVMVFVNFHPLALPTEVALAAARC
ncbi:MAG: hypothetical protein JWP75_3537 [Frondihabitans sp.]|nr:hypothetical protein [Frondihabitans sp.]